MDNIWLNVFFHINFQDKAIIQDRTLTLPSEHSLNKCIGFGCFFIDINILLTIYQKQVKTDKNRWFKCLLGRSRRSTLPNDCWVRIWTRYNYLIYAGCRVQNLATLRVERPQLLSNNYNTDKDTVITLVSVLMLSILG